PLVNSTAGYLLNLTEPLRYARPAGGGVSHMATYVKTRSPLALGIIALFLAACAPQAPQAGSGAQKGGGWNDVVAAANKEGKVVVVGSGSEEQRRALTDTFKQRYPQIDVE